MEEYVGQTKLRTQTCFEQYKKSIEKEHWDSSGVSSHAEYCKLVYNWDNAKILKIESRKFDGKVHEALEIQFQDTSPHSEHGLNQDDGQYVTTSFWKPMFAHLREKSLY